MNTEKQKWVEDVMASADKMVPAKSTDLTGKILDRIASGKQYSISPKSDNSLVWKIAASVIIITLMNVVTLYNYQSNAKKSLQAYEVTNTANELGVGQSNTSADPGTTIFGN